MRPSFGVFAFLSVLAFNPWAHAESYTLPGESSPPAAEELIGSAGLVGIYYGQLPKDGHPRLKMTLVLVADPKSGEPKGYMLERIGVTREPNTGISQRGRGRGLEMRIVLGRLFTSSTLRHQPSTAASGRSIGQLSWF